MGKEGLVDRIRTLELELASYKTYAAQRLPDNPDFKHEPGEGNGDSFYRNQINPLVAKKSQNSIDDEEDNENDIKYKSSNELINLIDNLTESNKALSDGEQKALLKFEKEYKRKIRLIEETNQIKSELESQMAIIMVENEALLKENQWRKEFNISNAKEIENYVKEIKILERKVADLENNTANWRLKYENQELIKKNVESNPQFRQSYINMMSGGANDVYKGRLSQVVKVKEAVRFSDRQRLNTQMFNKRGITTAVNPGIKEEANEDSSEKSDNLANEFGELDELDQPDFGALEVRGSDDDEDVDMQDTGIIRASEIDRDRFSIMDKDRSSHINIGVTARTFQKSALPTIDEDELYDPVREQLSELKKQTRDAKSKLLGGVIDEEVNKEDVPMEEEEPEDEPIEEPISKHYF